MKVNLHEEKTRWVNPGRFIMVIDISSTQLCCICCLFLQLWSQRLFRQKQTISLPCEIPTTTVNCLRDGQSLYGIVLSDKPNKFKKALPKTIKVNVKTLITNQISHTRELSEKLKILIWHSTVHDSIQSAPLVNAWLTHNSDTVCSFCSPHSKCILEGEKSQGEQ